MPTPASGSLGQRVDEILSQQRLQEFPEGTAPYVRATEAVERLKPELIDLMNFHQVTQVQTKLATALLSDDGSVTVTKNEVAM